MKQAISSVVDGLKASPLSLALLAMNVLFLVALGLLFRDVVKAVGETNERRDKMIMELARACEEQRK